MFFNHFSEEEYGRSAEEDSIHFLKSPNFFSKDIIDNNASKNLENTEEERTVNFSNHDDLNVLFNFKEWQDSNPDTYKVTKPT